ncbi:MAG: helix-turn-helix transcriptional regulator [Halosimplex sp.]
MLPGHDETEETPREVLAFLAQSENRVDVLDALADGEPRDRYDLEGAVDASRRTVLRVANELLERGYVRETDDGYRLTALGESVYDRYAAAADGIGALSSAAAVLSAVPAGVVDFDPARLADAEVTAAAPGDPFAPLDRMLELRRGASRVRELAPGVERRSVEQLADRVEADEAVDVEIVLTPASLETAESRDQYAPAHEVVASADAVALYLTPEPFALPVTVADETVALVADGAEGRPDAVLETDDPVVREWAESYVDRFVELADRIDDR